MTTPNANEVLHAATPQYTEFEDLFAQLGLPNTAKDIQDFICAHRPLPARHQPDRNWQPCPAIGHQPG